MKILIVADRLEILGGLETHVTTIARQLAEYENNKVTIYTNAISLRFRELLRNVEIIEGFNKKNTNSLATTYKPDIIHGHPFTGIGIAYEIATKCKAKLFITMHGDYSTGLTKEYVSKAEKVIFVSTTAFEACKKLVPANKCEMIHNPIDTDVFRKKAKSKNILKMINKEQLTIVVSSRIDDGKEIPMMQLARILPVLADRVNGLNVIFIGSGSKIDDLKAATNHIQSNLNIFILGEVSDVSGYLNIADLVLACDRCAIEALLCEKIVFYMGLGKWKSLITNDNYEQHLFSKDNFADYTDEELINHLAWMLIQKFTVKNNTNTLHEKMKELCGSDVVCEKHIDLYNKKKQR